MKTLLKNARYLDENFLIKEGNILIEDDLIKKISTEEDEADIVVDIEKNLIIPGFMNMHTHTPMTLLRGVDDENSLEGWLNNIFKREAKLTPRDIYVGSKLGILNYIKNGITTFADMYYHPLETARASVELGINSIVDLGFVGNDNNTIEIIENQIKEVEALGRDYYFACHSVYLRSESDFKTIIDFAKKHNKIVYTHASESETEVRECKEKHGGKTPIQLLKEYGFFEVKNAVAHGVHLEPEDFEILAHSDTTIVSNPASNLKLASGICPLKELVERKINCCVATDGPSSNNRLDMFREMYLAGNLGKLKLCRCDLIPSTEILKMATINGVKAFNLKNIGLVKEGFRADLVEIDLNSLNFVPHNDVISDLVYSASVSDIMFTMCGGKILYKNGEFLNISKEEINDLFLEAEKIIERLSKE